MEMQHNRSLPCLYSCVAMEINSNGCVANSKWKFFNFSPVATTNDLSNVSVIFFSFFHSEKLNTRLTIRWHPYSFTWRIYRKCAIYVTLYWLNWILLCQLVALRDSFSAHHYSASWNSFIFGWYGSFECETRPFRQQNMQTQLSLTLVATLERHTQTDTCACKMCRIQL